MDRLPQPVIQQHTMEPTPPNRSQLLLSRLFWLTLCLPSIGVFLVLLPLFYQSLLELPPLTVETLYTLGLSPALFAAIITIREFLFGLVFVTIGLFSVWRRSGEPLVILASIMLITIGTASSKLMEIVQPDSWTALIHRFGQTVSLVSPVIFLHIFPRTRFLRAWIKIIVLAWTVFMMFDVLIPDTPISLRDDTGTPSPLFDILFAAMFVGGLIVQLYRYQRISNIIERQQTKWIMIGFSVAIFGNSVVNILFGLYPGLLEPGRGNVLLEILVLPLFGYIPISFIALTIGFAILRYRLWDIDILINRGLVYAILTALLGLALFAVVAGLQAGVQALTGQSSDLTIVVATLIIAALVRPVQQRIQRVIDRLFYRAKIDSQQTMLEFSREIRTIVDQATLLRQLVDKMAELFQATQVAVYLRYGENTERFLLEAKHLETNGIQPELNLSTDEIMTLQDGTLRCQGQSLFPLIAQQADNNELIGVLSLGVRLGSQGYSREDCTVLESLALQAGTAIYVAQVAERQRQQLREANRLKSEFLATMSHELRTPLHAIMGYTDVQLQGLLGELQSEQRENLERILINATHLTALIDDVLDIAKIEAGRIDIAATPFVIRDWLQELVQKTGGLAEQKGLTFEVVLAEDFPNTVVGDPNNLMRAAINLVGNAIKFTYVGGVRIDVKTWDRNLWAFVVRDTGIGIAEDALTYIFDRFRQVDSSSKREYGGTGLGLNIVRELVLLMGGTIQVESKVDAGSTFTVLLPLKAMEQA